MQKSSVSLTLNNQQSKNETEIKKTILFTKASKRIKYLGVNLTHTHTHITVIFPTEGRSFKNKLLDNLKLTY